MHQEAYGSVISLASAPALLASSAQAAATTTEGPHPFLAALQTVQNLVGSAQQEAYVLFQLAPESRENAVAMLRL